MRRLNPRVLVILTLIAMIGFVTVTPVRSQQGPVFLDLTVSPPCVCSTEAIYTFHAENPGAALTGLTVMIPAGYEINSAYLTTTPGIIVATGFGGNWPWPPYTIDFDVEFRTTTTSGIFEVFVDDTSVGITGVLTPPTETTPGTWDQMLPEFGAGIWAEVSFVAGFFINPCTEGTYSWSPNTAYRESTSIPVDPRPGYTTDVTIVDCAVGGVIVPTNTFAILTPYIALAGLVAAVSTIFVIKKRK